MLRSDKVPKQIFLKIANDFPPLCSLTSKAVSLPRGGQGSFYLWSCLSSFLLMSLPRRVTWVKAMGSCAASTSNCSSPKWSFTSKWVGLAYKTQRQSPWSLITFVSDSPFSASVSLRGGGLIGNSGFYTNGLSRICNVAFFYETAEWGSAGTHRRRWCYHRKMWLVERPEVNSYPRVRGSFARGSWRIECVTCRSGLKTLSSALISHFICHYLLNLLWYIHLHHREVDLKALCVI